MINSARHEEYNSAENARPFIINADIERSASKISPEQNWHDEIEIELCTEGEGEILLDGKKYAFAEGDVALIGSNVLHHTGSKSRLVYSCIIPKTEFCRAVGFDMEKLIFEPIVHDAELSALVLCLINAQKDACTPLIEKCEMLLRILLCIQKKYASLSDAGSTTPRGIQSVRGAIDFIRKNFGSRLTLDMIAKSIYIDKYALCREFKQATGQTVIEYINSYRTQIAATMISGGATVFEAARACGFENMSFFTKTFKRYMETLPSNYKKHR
ncbi:MAG: helix-turn-helix domain-containing protein [Clostridia bacterium]|nr:helix-turn-helix domain-containing protein [Clostridia bacterium]